MTSKSLKKENEQKGGSTLEILLAFAILVLSISAVILVGFGNQSVAVDTETNTEALYLAQGMLENSRVDSRSDFFSVLSTPTIGSLIGPLSYEKKLDVIDITQCKKEVKSSVGWNPSSVRPQMIELTTILTDIAGTLALGGDCDTEPPGDWDNPHSAVSINISGQSDSTDIDVQNSFIYLTTDPSASGKDDFFIYEFNPQNLTLAERARLDVSSGLNAVDVAGDYAYIANNETSRQLIIMDISDSNSPQIIASSTLPQMSSGVGRSINYYNNKVYIGTQYLACPPSCSPGQNNEFHIYDVSNPINPTWMGSLNINHNVNKISVQGDFAYLATSANDGELMVVNISDPNNILHPDITGMKFNTTGNQDGTGLYILGNKAYLGLWRGSGTGNASNLHDFYVLDITNPSSITLSGSKDLGISNNAGVVGIRVKGRLAFIVLDQPTFGFKIINIFEPSLPDHTVCTTMNFSENASGMDMENDFVFTANKSNAEIRVIQDQESSCS